MSVVRRVRDITLATWNEMMEKSEDPIKVIEAYLVKQKQQIQQQQNLLQQTKSHAESIRYQYLHAAALAEKRSEQAKWAVKAGEDDVARMALQEQMQQQEKSERYRLLYEQIYPSVLELEQMLFQLQSEYQELLDQREYYVAKIRAAQLQRRWNEHTRRVSFDSNPLRRLEDIVEDLEFETDAWRDLRREESRRKRDRTTSDKVEQQLEQLKQTIRSRGETK